MQRQWWIGLVGVPSVVLAVSTVLLALEARQLRDGVQRWRAQAQWPTVNGILPPVSVARLDGRADVLALGDSTRQELWVGFTTTCPYCRESLSMWRSVADSAAARGVSVFWLSLSPLEDTQRYADSLGLPLDQIRVSPDRRALGAARLRAVPATVLTTGAGRVQYVKAGVFTTRDAAALLAIIDSTRALVVPPRTADRVRSIDALSTLSSRN